MSRILNKAFAGVLGLALVTGSAGLAELSADPGKGVGKGKHKDKGDTVFYGDKDRGDYDDGALSIDIRFGDDDRDRIRHYFRDHRDAYVPQGLPPGIAKNYARGKPLPPGIAKRYLPGELRRDLRPYPEHELLLVDNDVLLIQAATGIIVDILSDVL